MHMHIKANGENKIMTCAKISKKTLKKPTNT